MEENTYPSSVQEAQEHIRRIRLEKGLGDGSQQIGNIGSDLQAALQVLSTDLYTTATHFLLELIQNADDNAYSDDVEPTLSITYSPGRILLHCNELGFTRKNVEAISRICQSTKSGSVKSSGFVGEKGIGFKAVFKVASVVWISSGYYSFKFERDGHLGMIAPIWDTDFSRHSGRFNNDNQGIEDSPDGHSSGDLGRRGTQMLLELDKDCDQNNITNELRSYDSRILIFLRRLSRLEIVIMQNPVIKKSESKPAPKAGIGSRFKNALSMQASSTDDRTLPSQPAPAIPAEPAYQTILTRQRSKAQPVTRNPTRLSVFQDKRMSTFLVWRHTVKLSHTEPRRPGISSSEVVLAFPLDTDDGEVLQVPRYMPSQSVYAFLPIKSCGFLFLLHADFLLTADRGDIHESNQWNMDLVVGAAAGFVNAVRHMSTLKGPLRGRWVFYLPIKTHKKGLFQHFLTWIFNDLANTPLFETLAGQRKRPLGLMLAPTWLCDPSSGSPFFATKENKHKFLSPAYPVNAFYPTVLGIVALDEKECLRQLAEAIKPDPAAFFRDKSQAWHIDFSIALRKVANGHISILQTLPLVPVRGAGQGVHAPVEHWVAVRSETNGSSRVYFRTPDPSTRKPISLPEGTGIMTVHSSASYDPDRRRLLSYIGVYALNNFQVCGTINETHREHPDTLQFLRPEDLRSHLAFLYAFDQNKPFSYRGPTHWRLAGESGDCAQGHELYLPLDRPNTARHLQLKGGTCTSKYKFAHPIYLQPPSGAPDACSHPRNDEGQFDPRDRWYTWLQGIANLAIYPRLLSSAESHPVRPNAGEKFLHEDFHALIRGLPPGTWLSVLRDGWETFYSHMLDIPPANALGEDSLLHIYHKDVAEYLSSLLVPCKGLNSAASPPTPMLANVSATSTSSSHKPHHRMLPLNKTYRQRKDCNEKYGDIAPFLDIPDSENPAWDPVLRLLGVRSQLDLSFYVECLAGLRDQNSENPDMGIVRLLLKEIESAAKNEIVKLRRHFYEEPLICIPRYQRCLWVRPRECFWYGPNWYIYTYGLKEIYPERVLLFQSYLQLPDAGIDHVIREARVASKPERIVAALARHVADAEDDSQKPFNAAQLTTLRQAKMFPVKGGDGPFNKRTLEDADSNVRPRWFIADRAVFRSQFQDVLPVLDFSVEFVLQVRRVLEVLGLGHVFLSKKAVCVTEAHGDVHPHPALTTRYRTRSKFLFRLIPKDQPDKKQLREKFSSIEVLTASKVVQYWRAPIGLRTVQSTQADGKGFIESDFQGNLRVYIQSGYENELHPCELAEQIRQFFNIAESHRDLISVVLTANLESRLEEIFAERAIPPLVDEDVLGRAAAVVGIEKEVEKTAILSNDLGAIPRKTRQKEFPTGGDGKTRFSRLLSHARFDSSFLNSGIGSPSAVPSSKPGAAEEASAAAEAVKDAADLPSYDATAKTKHGSSAKMKKMPTPRIVPPAFTLASVLGFVGDDGAKAWSKELQFNPVNGNVIGDGSAQPQSFLHKIRGWSSRDSDLGEMIVSEVLDSILGAQYDAAKMWRPRNKRDADAAPFSFIDTLGRFGSFMMRLEGSPGTTQGYTRFSYLIDVKTTALSGPSAGHFKYSQAELDRARQYSSHNKPDVPGSEDELFSRTVCVLIHISNVRQQPKLSFIADPWDLFINRQISLRSTSGYMGKLLTQGSSDGAIDVQEETGFDTVQIREREIHGQAQFGIPDGNQGPPPPPRGEHKSGSKDEGGKVATPYTPSVEEDFTQGPSKPER